MVNTIRQQLQTHHNIGKLYNSYLIQTKHISVSFEEIKSCLSEFIFSSEKVDTHPDFMLVEKEKDSSKNITIDQIRKLQKFLYQTSVISGRKVAVIYNAELMNINAANSCLKVLEDTPQNTHLFLLAENADLILPTIHSRCVRIDDVTDSLDYSVDTKIIKLLSNNIAIEEKIAFIQEFTNKDRASWLKFANQLRQIIANMCKHVAGGMEISMQEQDLMKQLNNNSLSYLQKKYQEICQIIEDTVNFDLELRGSTVILIEKLKN